MAIKKPNPGCAMPELKVPTDITQLVADNKAAREAYQQAQQAVSSVISQIGSVIPGASLLGAVAARDFWKIQEAVENTAAAQQLAAAVSDAQALASRANSLTQQLSGVSCPLPDVVDKAADPNP